MSCRGSTLAFPGLLPSNSTFWDAGLDCVSVQIEAMHPQLFREVAPGKAKHAPYEAWLQAYLDTVDIFGVGNVTGTIGPGFTLFAPGGHKTWQEARDYHIEGNNWLIRNKIVPLFIPRRNTE